MFIVLCVFICSLFFRQQSIPGRWVTDPLAKYLPTNFVASVESVTVGFRYGVSVEGFRLYDRNSTNVFETLAGADRLVVDFLRRRVTATGLKYAQLPDGYYAPGNKERNSRVEVPFPEAAPFKLVLERPEILGLKPSRVEAKVTSTPQRLDFSDVFVKWPEDDARMAVSGYCTLDIARQLVHGEVKGLARQSHIRPMLVAIDVPVSLPYMDGFTDVAEPVDAFCRWQVNLVNNDLDLWLDLHPSACKYNSVAVERADGKIHLHNYTRGDCLNYRTTVGPVTAVSAAKKNLSGIITITGTNHYNIVDIDAKSDMPVAEVLKIAGFEDEYVDYNVCGTIMGKLQFRFPRSMTNNYEVMDGFGHIRVENGQLMRMKGFSGLIELLADKVPGVAYVTDRTQAKVDYVIEKGVLKTDGIYIEGGLFSMMMYGTFDIADDKLDFIVRTQFMKDKSLMATIVRPITWVFSKLLLEFRLTGSSEKPVWEYVSVIDRVVDAVAADKEDKKK